ncbi:MAG: glycosyltransferase [Candidatus Deferrimicrobiaceae bacterium]
MELRTVRKGKKMVLILEILATVSLSVCLLQVAFAWRAIRKARRTCRDSEFLPPVSILKPLSGVDDRLLDNLATFCLQDYPRYEILFCLQSPSDPALRVAQKIREMFPDREISIVIGDCRDGLNPKVNNMIPGYAAARYPYVLISDSNVSVGTQYLREAISHFRDPRIGLVNHLVRGVGGVSPGAKMENGHLNTFILGSICLLDRMFGMPCVVGKSMLMEKSEFDAMGGLHGVKDFLAEDYTIGALYRRCGKRVVISGEFVDTVNVYRGVREFLARHARWNRMRFSIAGPGYVLEMLSNPILPAFALAVASGGSREGIAAATMAGACKLAMDASMNVLLGSRLGFSGIAMGPLRDLLAAGIWFSAFCSRKVHWRGRTLRISRGSRLVADASDPSSSVDVTVPVLPSRAGIRPEGGNVEAVA